MSSISPVGSQPAVESPSGTQQQFGILGASLDTIAGMLSMSPTDLQAALKSGRSISDLAQQKGVSLDSIVQSVDRLDPRSPRVSRARGWGGHRPRPAGSARR